MEKKSKLFLVLCLHRSGSSATAGVMQNLGIHMGDKLLPASRHNPKGHFENLEYFQINQDLLRSVKSAWNRPPSRERIKSAKIPDTKIREFLKKQVKPVWGLKDPRTLLTFEIWKPYLEEVSEITYVFVHRPLEASVRSLAHRDRISISNASQILTTYLINLYYYRHTFSLPPENIIDVYYQDIIHTPEPFVSKFNEKIGNPRAHNLDRVKEFLDIKLKKF
ncbi:hypothetical protein DFO73_101181 [Cytobacillus oceanisediminis]|uniref:Sulfotransferase family protein n=1 Tax=Cytobacillus oceanisediminis TaxID=665099 RepID=A0A2V3A4I6_9BACI|nr:sulfotransferase family protein [Cytobacillus oceanisediminis]PWW31923.1 hypothetical protein DFO73_101181 [Cytobacillus oceanisediminis]